MKDYIKIISVVLILTSVGIVSVILSQKTLEILEQEQKISQIISQVPEVIQDTSGAMETATVSQNNDVQALSSTARRAAVGTVRLSIQDAYEEFEGKRIQIYNCVANPTRVTFKSGTKILLDNRSPEPVEIQLGAMTYRLYDYAYSVIPVSSQKLPVTLRMDCQMGDEIGKNIAQILVQR